MMEGTRRVGTVRWVVERADLFWPLNLGQDPEHRIPILGAAGDAARKKDGLFLLSNSNTNVSEWCS